MKKIIFLYIVVTATIFLASCGKKQQNSLDFTQDSIQINNDLQSKMAALNKSIDSLLPYSERKNFRDSLNRSYSQMFIEAIKERKAELGYPKADSNLFVGPDLYSSVKYELEMSGHGQKDKEKEYLDWARMHSKNPMMQQSLEEELSDLKLKSSYLKNVVK